MSIRFAVLSFLAVSTCALSAPLFAHDPSLHEQAEPSKSLPKPATCKQLADKEHYSADPTDKDVKALKARCDAEKKAAAKQGAKKD